MDADTDDGDHFVVLVPGRLIGPVAKHFHRALQQEFGQNLAIVLDNTPYFITKVLKKQAGADGLIPEYLPPYSPELDPL